MEGFWFGFKAVWAALNGKVVGMMAGILSVVAVLIVLIIAFLWFWELVVVGR